MNNDTWTLGDMNSILVSFLDPEIFPELNRGCGKGRGRRDHHTGGTQGEHQRA